MTIQTDFEARFPYIPWVEEVASTWVYYTCLEYVDPNKEAILNLIAHLLTLASNAAAGGGGAPARNVASKSVGSVSVSYEAVAAGGATSNLQSWYSTTIYGQAYWLLSGGRRVGARFV